MKHVVFLGLLSAVLTLTGCDLFGPKEAPPKPAKHFEPGYGQSIERPLGTPFTWPAGLVLLGRPTYDGCVEDPRTEAHWGNGDAVMLCLNLYNTTSQPIKLDLPPGLMFISDDNRAQNGLVINLISVEVPPGQHLYVLHSHCANLGRGGSGPEYTYDPRPVVTQHPQMQDLLRLLATKKINFEHYGGAYFSPARNFGGTVQRAVHRIAEAETIEPELLRELEALPAR
ncbi:hypothetical protein [Hymenobacter sp. B81]|uniref:hypothetical protein n=1 Tax=Hymenobacter sp. B81 TaxID=3344878 RepID=UPI0037DC4888